MPESHQYSEVLELFRRGPDILEAALNGVSPEESTYIPAPGKWSIREIARHVTDTEIVAGMRLRQIIAEDRPLMALFDQDLWAAKLNYRGCDPFASAAKFRVLREDMTEFLSALPESAFSRVGLHPERGAATLGEWTERFAKHVEKHADQIRRIREQWGGR